MKKNLSLEVFRCQNGFIVRESHIINSTNAYVFNTIDEMSDFLPDFLKDHFEVKKETKAEEEKK